MLLELGPLGLKLANVKVEVVVGGVLVQERFELGDLAGQAGDPAAEVIRLVSWFGRGGLGRLGLDACGPAAPS